MDINHIAPLIKMIDNAIKQRCDTHMKLHGLTYSQMDVLIFLLVNHEDEINSKDIEMKFNITNPTVTGILNRLEKKGFIRREVSSKDSRYKAIRVTETSRALDDELKESGRNLDAELTQIFSPEEKKLFISFLQRMLSNMQQN